MLPETINLKDAQSIISNLIEKEDFKAFEITFRFINRNGNGNDKSAFLTPDGFIANLNTAKTVKQLFYIWYQHSKEFKDYSPEEQTRVKQALNNKKKTLLR
jgi:hypothetical protein